MEEMRKSIWEREKLKRETLADIDASIYINHIYLKKFSSFGYKYNSEYEYQFLLKKDDEVISEYTLNPEGKLVPGYVDE